MRPAYVLLMTMVAAWPAAAEPLTIRTEDCRLLVRHVPAKDATYRPGVDVRGRAVAPADLDSGYPDIVPPEITIDIAVDLADRLTPRRPGGRITADRPILGYEGKVPLGKVSIIGDRVLWNGEDLQPREQAALAAACRTNSAVREPPPPKPPVPADLPPK